MKYFSEEEVRVEEKLTKRSSRRDHEGGDSPGEGVILEATWNKDLSKKNMIHGFRCF